MYKVFVNDKPIIFTSSIKNEENYIVYLYKNTTIQELIYKLKEGKFKGFYLYSSNLVKDWMDFKVNFKVVIAAGGLVLNEKKEILFIQRGSKWDLPKGKVELNETIPEAAIREVKEECGIATVILKDKLIDTHHLFYDKGKYRLKETHWYLMSTTSTEKLTPQIEEGITNVAFKNEDTIKEVLKNTFFNINLVYQGYIKLY